MSNTLKEFKAFAMRGNLIDTAIAFVMGLAFGKITTAFIDGMVMPLVSMIVQADFTAWKTILKPAVTGPDGKVAEPEVAIKYGDFVSSVIYFFIVAVIMFMVVKAVAAARKVAADDEAAAPAATPVLPPQEILLTEIRDILKSNKNA